MNYVIATSRPWNEVLANRLERKTGQLVCLITNNDELTLSQLDPLNPRYIFFPHWSYIIPEAIHNKYECVIFHMTDLPYGRGGSPLQNLIIRGHKTTQISALRCVKELDNGPIYMKRPLSLEGSAGEIFLRASGVIEKMITEIIVNEPEPTPQTGDPVLFKRRKPEESNLSNARISKLDDLYDFIRMLDADGYPRAYIDLHGYRIQLSDVQLKGEALTGNFVIHSPISESANNK